MGESWFEVMSSQARDAQAPVLEGEVAGPGYGAMDLHGAPQRPELPNGVPSRQAATEQGGFAAGADEVRAVTGAPRASGLHESEMARVEAATGDGPRTVERPFLSPESNQRLPDLASPQGPPGVANPEPELSRDTTRTLDVEVMYGGEQGVATSDEADKITRGFSPFHEGVEQLRREKMDL
ncbi:hypothetical protein AK812_SmicGene48233, partial [Symbiodinium microadriaticum]